MSPQSPNPYAPWEPPCLPTPQPKTMGDWVAIFKRIRSAWLEWRARKREQALLDRLNRMPRL